MKKIIINLALTVTIGLSGMNQNQDAILSTAAQGELLIINNFIPLDSTNRDNIIIAQQVNPEPYLTNTILNQIPQNIRPTTSQKIKLSTKKRIQIINDAAIKNLEAKDNNLKSLKFALTNCYKNRVMNDQNFEPDDDVIYECIADTIEQTKHNFLKLSWSIVCPIKKCTTTVHSVIYSQRGKIFHNLNNHFRIVHQTTFNVQQVKNLCAKEKIKLVVHKTKKRSYAPNAFPQNSQTQISMENTIKTYSLFPELALLDNDKLYDIHANSTITDLQFPNYNVKNFE